MAKSRKNSFSTNFILQAGGLTVPILLFQLFNRIYQIPLVNIIGTTGIGYYTTVWNCLLLTFLVTGYGLSLVLSRLVHSRIGHREYKGAQQLFMTALALAAIVSGVLSLIFYLIGDHIIGAFFYRSIGFHVLRSLLPAFILMMLSGVLLGYFSGLGNSGIVGIYLFIYQVINIPLGLLVGYKRYQEGIDAGLVYRQPAYPAVYGAVGASKGIVFGVLGGFLLLLFIYMISHKALIKKAKRDQVSRSYSYLQLARFLSTGVVSLWICYSVYHLMRVADNFLFSRIMRGLSFDTLEITSLWGEYAGKYLVLVEIPILFSLWMGSRGLDSFNRAYEREDKGQMISSLGLFIKLIMIFAIPAALWLTFFAGPITRLLFVGDNQIAKKMLQIGSGRIVLVTLVMAAAGILKLLKRNRELIINTGIALIVYIILIFVLVFGAKLSIYGLVIANLVFAAIAGMFHLRTVMGRLGYRPEFLGMFFFPLVASVCMSGLSVAVYMLLTNWIDNNLLGILMALIVAFIIYVVMILKLKCLDEAELRMLPGGRKMVSIYKMLRLL